ncbi:hypothetical protein [Thioclava sp.]|uniref:hypothetical protein n=1 Tax=Thioclava sp. TaxID=1933450 RepID=UPI003AA94C5F
MNFVLQDDSELWLTDILTNHYEEARSRALSLIAEAEKTETGCIVTPTKSRRKVRFRGHQTTAYRFIYCVLTRTPASFEDVIRHRCHNPLCINPEHLEIGSRADNKHDDWEFAAYGVDFNLL